MVSVIIPVYNSQKFLINSIESILNQTYKDIEILAIDDGSIDNSLKILKQFEDKITIISQTNKGLSGAINVGIKNMSGNWMKWFSPDDILYPDAIEILVDEAKRMPENTIVYSDWEIINEKGEKIRNFFESDYNNLTNFEFNIRLLDNQQININTTLIPSSLLNKGCVIRNLKDPVAIDYDFLLRAGILYDTKFHLIPRSTLRYRTHKGQLSHINITKTLSNLDEIRGQILSELDSRKRELYLTTLDKYKKKKPLSRKTMEFGLKIISIFPDIVTNSLLVFYLNKIRSRR